MLQAARPKLEMELPYKMYRLVKADGTLCERIDKHPFAMSRCRSLINHRSPVILYRAYVCDMPRLLASHACRDAARASILPVMHCSPRKLPPAAWCMSHAQRMCPSMSVSDLGDREGHGCSEVQGTTTRWKHVCSKHVDCTGCTTAAARSLKRSGLSWQTAPAAGGRQAQKSRSFASRYPLDLPACLLVFWMQ